MFEVLTHIHMRKHVYTGLVALHTIFHCSKLTEPGKLEIMGSNPAFYLLLGLAFEVQILFTQGSPYSALLRLALILHDMQRYTPRTAFSFFFKEKTCSVHVLTEECLNLYS